MDFLSAVDRRMSRRSYAEAPERQEAFAVEQYLHELNAQSGLSFEMLLDGGTAFFGLKSYGMFSGVHSLLLLKGKMTDKDLHEKAGYFGEKAVLFATCLNLGTCWVSGTYNAKSKTLKISRDERLVAVVPIGRVSEQLTPKEKFIQSIVHKHSKSAEQLLQSDALPPDWLLSAMRSVQKAPSARNAQRVLFSCKNGIVSASVPDKYDTDRVDLGIAKLHFELAAGGRFALGNGAAFTKDGESRFVDTK
jgi:hypothetical protein